MIIRPTHLSGWSSAGWNSVVECKSIYSPTWHWAPRPRVRASLEPAGYLFFLEAKWSTGIINRRIQSVLLGMLTGWKPSSLLAPSLGWSCKLHNVWPQLSFSFFLVLYRDDQAQFHSITTYLRMKQHCISVSLNPIGFVFVQIAWIFYRLYR